MLPSTAARGKSLHPTSDDEVRTLLPGLLRAVTEKDLHKRQKASLAALASDIDG